MRSSAIHGNGVFAIADIAENQEIIEYGGKRLTHTRADHKYGGSSITGHTFLFTLNDDYVIDGNQDGNDARWINHSCAPNCEAVLVEHEDDPEKSQVFIEAIRAIRPGEELTYDYGIPLAERHTPRLKQIWACRCGSKDCTGTMLKPKRPRATRHGSLFRRPADGGAADRLDRLLDKVGRDSDLDLDLRYRHVDAAVLGGTRVANARQHVGNRVVETHALWVLLWYPRLRTCRK